MELNIIITHCLCFLWVGCSQVFCRLMHNGKYLIFSTCEGAKSVKVWEESSLLSTAELQAFTCLLHSLVMAASCLSSGDMLHTTGIIILGSKNQKNSQKMGICHKDYLIQQPPLDRHFYSPYHQDSWRYSKHFSQKCLESPRPWGNILGDTQPETGWVIWTRLFLIKWENTWGIFVEHKLHCFFRKSSANWCKTDYVVCSCKLLPLGEITRAPKFIQITLNWQLHAEATTITTVHLLPQTKTVLTVTESSDDGRFSTARLIKCCLPEFLDNRN